MKMEDMKTFYPRLEQPFQYTQKHLRMIEKLNLAIKQRELTPEDYSTKFGAEMVKTVLEQQCCYDPSDVLDALWQVIFVQETLTEVGDFDGQYSPKYSAEDIELSRQILKRLDDHELRVSGVTAAAVAKKLGKTPGWFSQIVNGKYTADPSKHLRSIWAAIEPAHIAEQTAPTAEIDAETNKAKLAQINLRYGDVPFVKTSMSELIDYTCAHAKRARRFSVFAGAPGLGKTYGLEEYIRQNPQTLLVVGHEQMTANILMAALAAKLGLPKMPGSSRQLEGIIRTLHMADRIIILDEADKCKPNALDPLRTISDRAHVGVVLIGNTKLTDRLQSEDRYELIASRVCFWPMPKGQLDSDDIKHLFLSLTQQALPLADNDTPWWAWLHQRVEGNARLLCENLLPHLVSVCSRDPSKKVDRMLVNSIFKQVLNKPAL